MTCTEAKTLLNAYVDGELDSAGSIAIETHIHRCISCSADFENLRVLASGIRTGSLRFQVTPRLKSRIETSVREAYPQTKSSLFAWRWLAGFAAAIVVVIAFAVVVGSRKASEERQVVNDIVSSHVRSMMANHITDVSSSDSHTVKPWFNGKLDYSPPTKDLTEQGFRLVGGRLDYLETRPVAALVYQRNQHFINLFVWPADVDSIKPQDRLAMNGFNIIHWTQSDMSYWLISDLNPTELGECARLLQR